MSEAKPTHLSQKISINKLELKNRMVMSPLCTGYAAPDGSVTERMIDYYEERARGGVGLILVEYSYIDDQASKSLFTQLGVHHDGLLPGLSDLAESIKLKGARAGLQICHCGRQRFLGKPPVVAPSRIPWKLAPVVPAELTVEEIVAIEESFAQAALRVKRAGFDLVEIHGAHGYLILQFLSPFTNRRTDLYGGSLENRARFALEVVQKIRKAVGLSFPVGFRISGDEYLEGGFRVEEAMEVSVELERAGVDLLHVSGGMIETDEYQIVPMYLPRGYNVHLAEAVKKVVKLPVIASGSITSPDLAEEILQKGKADLISLGRPLVADPYFPQKALAGKGEDIRRCIRCNEGCVGRIRVGKTVRCTVNAACGRERKYKLSPGRNRKSVLVVGGGPGGLECARVLARRGHQVRLYEKEGQFGGNAAVAALPHFKTEIDSFIRFLVGQNQKLGVEAKLNQEVNWALVREINPEAIVIAAGAEPYRPDIPGINQPQVVTAIEVLTGTKKIPLRVLIAGGGMAGCEVAWFLAEKGYQVTVVEMLDEIALDAEKAHRAVLLERLAQMPVKVVTGLKVMQITEEGIIGMDRNFESRSHPASGVILAMGLVPRTNLIEELTQEGFGGEVYRIGDCAQPGRIIDAVHQAAAVAREI